MKRSRQEGVGRSRPSHSFLEALWHTVSDPVFLLIALALIVVGGHDLAVLLQAPPQPQSEMVMLPPPADPCNAKVEQMVQQGLTPLTCDGRAFDPATGTFR